MQNQASFLLPALQVKIGGAPKNTKFNEKVFKII